MTQFKRAIHRLLRLSPKTRQPFLCVTPIAHTGVTDREPICLSKIAYPALDLTDTDAKEVEEDKESDDDSDDEKDEKDDDNDDDDDDEKDEKDDDDEKDEKDDERDIPETVPRDLTRKTRLDMMLHRLHVSAVASELEIAAFCMRQTEKFTHIINLTFTSPPVDSANNISPSDWSWKETEMCLPTDAQGFRPSRLRLTCPDFLCRLGEHQSTLTVQQFRAARDYMKRAFPDMPADWARDEQLDMPFVRTPEYAEGTRVLIVGPPDRSVDLMGILIRYLSFLTGQSPSVLLDRVQKPSLAHKHWRFRPLAETSSATGVERW